MNSTDKAEFGIMRNLLIVISFVALCFLVYTELNTVKASIIQSDLEAEYAYDYACSPSSQIIKRAEYERSTYISYTVWVNCVGYGSDVGNFPPSVDEQKKLHQSNPYDEHDGYDGNAPASWAHMTLERGLSVLPNII